MIKGDRLTLRAIERDDLPRYVAWLNDPEVRHHLSIYLPISSQDEADWYEFQRKDPAILNFAIIINEGNVHIGSIGFLHLNHREQNAELGIVIGDKTQWNKGYGGEAIGMLLDFGFNELNLHRIYLRVDASNIRGIRCYQRCGFMEEGRLRNTIYQQGHFEDQLIMSILRPEYQRG